VGPRRDDLRALHPRRFINACPRHSLPFSPFRPPPGGEEGAPSRSVLYRSRVTRVKRYVVVPKYGSAPVMNGTRDNLLRTCIQRAAARTRHSSSIARIDRNEFQLASMLLGEHLIRSLDLQMRALVPLLARYHRSGNKT